MRVLSAWWSYLNLIQPAIFSYSYLYLNHLLIFDIHEGRDFCVLYSMLHALVSRAWFVIWKSLNIYLLSEYMSLLLKWRPGSHVTVFRVEISNTIKCYFFQDFTIPSLLHEWHNSSDSDTFTAKYHICKFYLQPWLFYYYGCKSCCCCSISILWLHLVKKKKLYYGK